MNTPKLWSLLAVLAAQPALAQNLGDLGKQAFEAGKTEGAKALKAEANKAVVKKVNATLLSEGRKNQCSFKTDSDELAPGCDAKVKRLSLALIEAKKALVAGGYSGFKFVVSGHTDSAGSEDHNKELSEKRAAVMVKELVGKGVPADEIEAVGMGSSAPLVKPDDTPAKKAKNRRYEIQVKL